MQFIPLSVLPLLPQMLYLYRNPSIADEVESLFSKIEKEYSESDSLCEDSLRALTHLLFLLLARNMKTRTPFSPVNAYHDYIERAVDYLQNNFTSEISLTEIAKMFSVTSVHFSRMFKKETGFGLCEYINILRLQRAEMLIKQDKTVSVTEIAAECGFADSNYFSTKFKKMYGVSPKSMMMNTR